MRTSVSSLEGGKSMNLAPDVCYLPAPPPPSGPGGIPTPYPNSASHSSAKKTTKKIFVRNKKCLVEGSFIPNSMGDEPGCSQNIPPGKQGLKARKNKGKCEFTKHSGKVKMQGKGVICQSAGTKQNNQNTMGKHGLPSQSTVQSEM
jgi:hypothetical protein